MIVVAPILSFFFAFATSHLAQVHVFSTKLKLFSVTTLPLPSLHGSELSA